MPSEKHVTLEWRGDMRFESTVRPGATVVLDTTPEHGGQNAGVQPMELLLISLAGCSAMDVISILRKKRQEVTDFRIKVDGIRRDEHPKVYTDVTITYIVTGHNLSEEAVARAIELSVTKYCSVFATVSQTATMHTRYEIHEAEPALATPA